MAIYFNQEDPLCPVVIAVRDNGKFLLRCPHAGCLKRLSLPMIFARQRIACPACRGSFLTMTKRQWKDEGRRAKQRKKDMKRWIREMRKRGGAPPDRISIFGGTSSGKSVYLAAMYQHLWNSSGVLAARALHGVHHKSLLDVYSSLESGSWIPGTMEAQAFDLALRFGDLEVTLSNLDYGGERLKEVLFEHRLDHPDSEHLQHQIQSTMGALILIDPQQAIDPLAPLDMDFIGAEIMARMAAQKMQEHVVIVLTKRNENKVLVEKSGGPESFVRKFLPHLYEAAPDAPVFHISSIATRLTDDLKRVPTRSGDNGEEVLGPLLALLQLIDPQYLAYISSLDREALDAAMEIEDNSRSVGEMNGIAVPLDDLDDLDDENGAASGVL